jgi:hypothetical protein
MSSLSEREDSEGPLRLLATVNTTARRDQSELLEETFDAWRYGDDASLYSIAEDSREGRQSDITSRASEAPSRQSDINSRASEVPSKNSRGVGATGSAVEVRWMSQDGGKYNMDSEDGYEDDYYPAKIPGHNTRRLRMCAAASVIFILVLAVILGVTLSQDNDPTRSNTGSGVTVGDTEGGQLPVEQSAPAPTTSPSASPSARPSITPTSSPSKQPEPTSSPTSTSELLAVFYLKAILSSCTQEYILLDETTLQGQVFRQLVEEEVATATDAGGGQIFFDINRGPAFILERYALMMLFLSTNGQDWLDAARWMDPDSDVCSWFGVLNCSQRRGGSCAVLNINLSKLSSSGLGSSMLLSLCAHHVHIIIRRLEQLGRRYSARVLLHAVRSNHQIVSEHAIGTEVPRRHPYFAAPRTEPIQLRNC